MELFIIDAIGPFFRDYDKDIINWSKIPFENLEIDGKLDRDKFRQIKRDFSIFIEKVSEIGYNAISIDDVAHLIDFNFYPESLKDKIKQYRKELKELFHIARNRGLKIFVNTDIMFYNKGIDDLTKGRDEGILMLLKEACHRLIDELPIEGIIFRIGESDGLDVKGDFLSRLTIKTTKQAREYIKTLLPIFERKDKYMIFRTWTVGAYEVGDLIWNKRTYDSIFKDIHSAHLIISMKYGNTDFFRDLELNPLFFNGKQKKIIELQARREREGSAINPYYVGWEYEKYARKLKNLENLVGISLWCQTGGWARWRDLTFIHNSSKTNELNTYASLKIFKENISADSAIEEFFGDSEYIKFYKLYEKIFSELLYVKGFSEKKLFFRRVRVPPLIWTYWDRITVTNFMIVVHEFYGGKSPDVDYNSMEEILTLGRKLEIEDVLCHYHTLRMLRDCRRALSGEIFCGDLMQKIEIYKDMYPDRYDFNISASRRGMKFLRFMTEVIFRIFIREGSDYRSFDRFLISRSLSTFYDFFIKIYSIGLPSFVNKESMTMEVLFS
ncbi:hypothetical protein GF312_02250 [Candidatus Poribacteria bacterium]|nr:hypothetical protein [Candidatus Poribacteria bacterium]